MSTSEERQEQMWQLDLQLKQLQLEDQRYVNERRKTLSVTEDQHNTDVLKREHAQAEAEQARRVDEDAWLDVCRPAQLSEWASVAQHRRNVEASSARHGEYLSRVANATERNSAAWERIATALEKIANKAWS